MAIVMIESISHGRLIELFLVSASAGITWSGMCYTVCGMVHIKDPLLLIEKSSPSNGSSRFPLSLSSPLPYV